MANSLWASCSGPQTGAEGSGDGVPPVTDGNDEDVPQTPLPWPALPSCASTPFLHAFKLCQAFLQSATSGLGLLWDDLWVTQGMQGEGREYRREQCVNSRLRALKVFCHTPPQHIITPVPPLQPASWALGNAYGTQIAYFPKAIKLFILLCNPIPLLLNSFKSGGTTGAFFT